MEQLYYYSERNRSYQDSSIIVLLYTFHLYVATFQQHLYIEYISLSKYNIPAAPVYRVYISQLMKVYNGTIILLSW
jgi:hypothetical protein